MARTLENEAKKAMSVDLGHVREPRQLYKGDRMHTLHTLKLSAIEGPKQLERMKHVGNFARQRQKPKGLVSMDIKRGRGKAIAKFNKGRDDDFAEKLVQLTVQIGTHLAGDGHVPDGVWSEFDNLNNNRRFFRKTEVDLASTTRSVVGPGSYISNEFQLPQGGRLSGGTAHDGGAHRTEAQLAASDRMKHQESSFRTSKDYGPQEQEHLQRLYEELGRPRFTYQRGDRDYEEHLDKFGYRHIQIFHRRSMAEVKDRVHHCLRFNRFKELGEGDYWDAYRNHKQPDIAHFLASAPAGLGGGLAGAGDIGAGAGRGAGSVGRGGAPLPSLSATRPRAPAWGMGAKLPERERTPPPGPAEGGSEPYDYRSIGRQVDSEKPDAPGMGFARAGAAGSTLTIAEEIANLTPTPTTYTPKVAVTMERVRAFPWARSDGEGSMVPDVSILGPGSYEAPTLFTGKQFDSTRPNHLNPTVPFARGWTGRLDRSLEPIKEKYGNAAPLPAPPNLRDLVP